MVSVLSDKEALGAAQKALGDRKQDVWPPHLWVNLACEWS